LVIYNRPVVTGLLNPEAGNGNDCAVITIEYAFSALTFTFSSLVLASVIYSLPFVVQSLQNAFVVVGKNR